MSTEQTPATPPPSQPASAQPADTEGLITFDDFMRVQLRVGEIVSAEAIPKSKKLLKLKVNLGPALGERQILAGIALHFQPEQLTGRKIVVVANLKPAMLMGLESQGMLLAASTEGDGALKLVDPGQDMPAGAVVR